MDENRTPKREPNGGGGNNKKPKNRQSLFMFLMMCSIVMLAWTYFGEGGTNSSSKEITYTEFLDMVEDETISSVEIEGNQLNITPKAKISENTEKITNPGNKTIYRIYDKETGKMRADVICFADEFINENEDLL